MRGPMYATSSPRTSRYHRIALCRSETTIAIVSMPRTPIFSPRGATESRAMNLPATFGESLVPGTATVHLGVPLHDFVVRDAIDLLLHRELILGFPQIDDPAGGRVALELRDHELPLPPAGFERRHHLGAIEDDVAIAHVELRDDRLAQIQEQVVHRREHELSAEPELPDAVDVVLQDPHHGALAAGEEAFREPALSFELPETLAGLPHVVLEPRVGRKGFRRRHAEAPDDPAQDLSAGLIPTDLQVRNEAIAVVRVPRLGRDALLVERVGKKIALLEVDGHDRPVRDEIGEPHEAGSLPCGEVLRLRDVLALESRDTQHIDPPKGVERHHPHEAVDRLLQQIRRRQVELADLDAPAHLPDLSHPDEVPVLHEGEEPTLPVAARDLGPQGLRPGI